MPLTTAPAQCDGSLPGAARRVTHTGEMITNGNPEVIEFQQTLDELEVFSSNHDLPELMRRRCA